VPVKARPERAKALIFSAFALSGRNLNIPTTQGDALGYELAGPSGCKQASLFIIIS